jgi:hypothetical protein
LLLGSPTLGVAALSSPLIKLTLYPLDSMASKWSL